VLVWHGALAHGGSPIRDANRTRRSVVGHFTTTDSHPALARRKIEEGIIFGGATADRVEAYRKSRRAGLKARLRRLLGR